MGVKLIVPIANTDDTVYKAFFLRHLDIEHLEYDGLCIYDMGLESVRSNAAVGITLLPRCVLTCFQCALDVNVSRLFVSQTMSFFVQ